MVLKVHGEDTYRVYYFNLERGPKEISKGGTNSKQWLLWEYKDKMQAINGGYKRWGSRRRAERRLGSLISLDRRLGFRRRQGDWVMGCATGCAMCDMVMTDDECEGH